MPLEPFKPAFGGKLLPVGCSDKVPGRNHGRDIQKEGPKLTTYTRTTAAIEKYWQDKAAYAAAAAAQPAHSTSPAKADAKREAKLPGGETAQAHKTREACWKDSVQLSHQPERCIPPCSGIPADIEEKEVSRTRGIPGFTGKQPLPGLSRPPPPAPDTSSWVAINAFDERRPRVKGIPGYTGHQPPSPDRRQAAAGDACRHDEQYDHSTHSWMQPTQPHTATTAGLLNQGSQQHEGQKHPACSTVPIMSHQDAALRPAAATAAGYGSTSASSSSSSAPGWVQMAGQHRPWSGAAVTDAPSTPYSPRYFINGEEIPSDHVPLPLSATTTTSCVSSNHSMTAGQEKHAPTSSAGLRVSAACTHACGCYCHQQPLQQEQCRTESHMPYCTASNTTPPTTAQAVAHTAGGSRTTGHAAVHGAVGMQRPVTAFSGLPCSRQTTYAAAYAPAAGFGALLQKQLSNLQLSGAGGCRPGSSPGCGA